jgi:hypothetical protein
MQAPLERVSIIVMGCLILFWGLRLWWKRQRLLQEGLLTTGVVVGHDDGPIVKFYTEDQQVVVVKPPGSPSRRYHLDGARISVYYNPNNPQDFVLDTNEHSTLPFLFMTMGVVFIVGGIFQS